LSPQLSIIVPVLNDGLALEKFSKSLGKQTGLRFETIVVNGGVDTPESDKIRDICTRSHFLYLTSARGRGKQMNLGRRHAKTDTLLFLHADSEFSSTRQLKDAHQALRARAKNSTKIAGHFSLHFQTVDTRLHFALRFLEKKSKLNRKNATNGDQGLLIGTSFFDDIGGFSESLPFLEDQIIGQTIRERGEMFTLPHPILTSARRFEEEGFVRRYYLMMIIMGAYRTQTQELFDLAPPLYINQDEAQKLDMGPFFDTFKDLHRTLGLASSIQMWRELGAFVRENAWQAFLFGDYLFFEDKDIGPFMTFFEDHVEDLDGKLINDILAIIAYITVTKSAPFIYRSLRQFRKLGLAGD